MTTTGPQRPVPPTITGGSYPCVPAVHRRRRRLQLFDYTSSRQRARLDAVCVHGRSTADPQPRTYPYLNDEFFYTGFGGVGHASTFAGRTGGRLRGRRLVQDVRVFRGSRARRSAADRVRWRTGSNFDWLRQDIKPGQLNLNLIMDEEVFFSIAGRSDHHADQRPERRHAHGQSDGYRTRATSSASSF